MIAVLNAGHRERQALLAWWKKNVTDNIAMPYWKQLEKTEYDAISDCFFLPQGGVTTVTECIQLEGSI
jgi:hypothetical protein